MGPSLLANLEHAPIEEEATGSLLENQRLVLLVGCGDMIHKTPALESRPVKTSKRT